MGKTDFNNALFENQNKCIFDVEDLSKVSFLGTDITRIRFGPKINWGGEDGFRVIDEELLLEGDPQKIKLKSILAVYRNLRKNYEYYCRYEEADKFYAREIELVKKYNFQSNVTISDMESITRKLEDVENERDELREKIASLEKTIEKNQTID
jgi:hypothetical protein